MKILHVAETFKGGIATFFKTFGAVCGDEVGIENHFVIPAEQEEHLAPELSRATFRRRRRGLGAVLALARKAEAEARAFEPDVIWFHSTFSFGAMVWLRMRGVPGHFVYAAHGWSQLRDTGLKAWFFTAVERRLTRFPDLVVNISKNDQMLAERSGYGSRHVVVENALADLDHWPDEAPFAATSDRLNLLFVGRFERQKGLDLLLEAFPAAQARTPELHLHVVGRLNDSEVTATAENDHITFYDWVPFDRMPAFHKSADLVVMPSRWEGLPMALIEALRAGTPIMVSDASNLPGLIEPGISGLVTPLEPHAMAAALSALNRPDLAAMRGPARALYERRYSASRFRTEMLDALHSLQPVQGVLQDQT